MPTTTRKRFERKPGVRISETETDFQILYWVYRRRLLTTNQIKQLFPHRSGDKLVKRVTSLFDIGWLDKPKAQIGLFPADGGTHPHVTALTKDGAKALADHYGITIPPSRWTQMNKEMKAQSMPHILRTSDFVVATELSARRHADQFRVDYSHEIISELSRERPNKSKPLSFRVPVAWVGKRSVRSIEPDELLRLKILKLKERNTTQFMVEIDKDTETIEPNEAVQKNDGFWRSSSILKKFVLYANAFKDERCRPFDFEVFRPLMVTTTPHRMKSMQMCEEKHLSHGDLRRPPGFILYTNWEAITASGNDVLNMPWQDRSGKSVFLHGSHGG